jgi:hypothetical protein
MRCVSSVVTHCIVPPSPPNPDFELEIVDWNQEPIIFGGEITYSCARGQRLNSNVEDDSMVAICNPGNSWTEPAWEDCVESETNQTN